MLRRLLATLVALTLSLSAHAQKQRHFTFHYSFAVRNVPAGKPVRIWIPLAHSEVVAFGYVSERNRFRQGPNLPSEALNKVCKLDFGSLEVGIPQHEHSQ